MFKSGDDFPGDQHRARFVALARYRDIVRGDHRAAWNARKALNSVVLSDLDYGQDRRVEDLVARLNAELSIVVNLPRVIQRKFASMVMRGIDVVSPDAGQNEVVQEIVARDSWLPLLHKSAFRVGAYGNAILTIRRDADGSVHFDARDPWTWYPTTDPVDGMRVIDHTFAWITRRDDRDYLMQEIHSAGVIQRVANALSAGRVGAAVTWGTVLGGDVPEWRPEEFTGIDEPLVAIMQNVTDDESLFGDSDLLGNESLFHEVTARVSQVSKILDDHADPKLIGPKDALRKKPDGSSAVDIAGSRYLPREDPQNNYEYLTWDARLEEGYGHLDRAVRLACITSEMSPALIGLAEGAGVEATETLRVRAINTIDAVEAKRLFVLSGLRAAFRIALKMRAVAKPVPVTVNFGDPLPTTRQDVVEAVDRERRAGLLSKRRALERINPQMAEQDIDRELELLDNEERATLSAFAE